MKKLLLITLCILPLLALNAQKPKYAPIWPSVDYKEVRVYTYNLDNQLLGKFQPVKNGKLDGTILQPGAILNKDQEQRLLVLLNGDTQVFNDGLAGCYEPHHAFVFYDEKGTIVASVDVCFLCEGMRFYPAKKYFKKQSTYNTKTEAQAHELGNKIKLLIKETNVPVFEKTEEYVNYSKTLCKHEAFILKQETSIPSVVRFFNTQKDFTKRFVTNYQVDSLADTIQKIIARKTFTYKSDNNTIVLSTYNGNKTPVIKHVIARNEKTGLFKGFDIGSRKAEVFETFGAYIKSYFYCSTLELTFGPETFIIHFGEDQLVDTIEYRNEIKL